MSAMPGKKTTNLSKSAAFLGHALHIRPVLAQQRALVLGHLLYKLLACNGVRTKRLLISDCIALPMAGALQTQSKPSTSFGSERRKPEAAPSMPCSRLSSAP